MVGVEGFRRADGGIFGLLGRVGDRGRALDRASGGGSGGGRRRQRRTGRRVARASARMQPQLAFVPVRRRHLGRPSWQPPAPARGRPEWGLVTGPGTVMCARSVHAATAEMKRRRCRMRAVAAQEPGLSRADVDAVFLPQVRLSRGSASAPMGRQCQGRGWTNFQLCRARRHPPPLRASPGSQKPQACSNCRRL